MSEFSWLPNSVRKQVPYLPEIIFGDDFGASGYYLSPTEKNPRGLIVICDAAMNEDALSSTIAHEFRHHWQMFNFGMPKKIEYSWSHLYKTLGYEQAIVRYFNEQEHERDALIFEYTTCKNEYTEYWVKKILKWRI
jgi:hypothetical protein